MADTKRLDSDALAVARSLIPRKGRYDCMAFIFDYVNALDPDLVTALFREYEDAMHPAKEQEADHA